MVTLIEAETPDVAVAVNTAVPVDSAFIVKRVPEVVMDATPGLLVVHSTVSSVSFGVTT